MKKTASKRRSKRKRTRALELPVPEPRSKRAPEASKADIELAEQLYVCWMCDRGGRNPHQTRADFAEFWDEYLGDLCARVVPVRPMMAKFAVAMYRARADRTSGAPRPTGTTTDQERRQRAQRALIGALQAAMTALKEVIDAQQPDDRNEGTNDA